MDYWPLTFFHVSSDLLLPFSHGSRRVPSAPLEIPFRNARALLLFRAVYCVVIASRHRGNSAPILRRVTKAPDILRVVASGGCALRRSSGGPLYFPSVKKTCRPFETWPGEGNAIICEDITELSPTYQDANNSMLRGQSAIKRVV